MKQLIARVPEDLHARLRRRARGEGRSLNALVNEVLQEAAPPARTPGEDVLQRLRAAGRLVELSPPKGPVPSLDEVIEMNRGIGPFIVDQIIADRRRR